MKEIKIGEKIKQLRGEKRKNVSSIAGLTGLSKGEIVSIEKVEGRNGEECVFHSRTYRIK